MPDMTIEKATINPERLDAELRAALGEACLGLSFSEGRVRVHLAAAPTPQQAALVAAIVRDHDPARLTGAQQTARERETWPVFRLDGEALAAEFAALDEAAFRREVARALAALRILLRGS